MKNYQKYTQQLKEQKEKEIELTALRDIIEQLTREIATLEIKKGNQESARKIINQSLAYIFFDNQRLVLDPVGNEYILKVRGKKVKPSQVSTGERNAIALAYFFIHLAEGKEENNLFSDEILLIIDDPISSFDIENKVGIMSFLRWRLGEVLTGCATTKLLLMTHDIGVMFDFAKLFEEISKQCKKYNIKSDFICYHLENRKIDSFSYKKHNEYGKLLNCIYEYAKNPIDNEIHDIGNIMRRV
jgi:wobble nucleotide-excising tRNase